MRRRLLIALFALASLAALPITPAAGAVSTTAGFGYAPSSPLPGEEVTFTSTSQAADGATIIDYKWDLDGDGNFETDTGLSPTATYTYSIDSRVPVRLQVTDDLGGSDRVRHVVTVGNGGNQGGSGPSASFTFSPAAPVAGQPVLFTSTSSDPDGPITDQAWDLDGDSKFDNGGGPTALRTFAAPGSYVVGLRVTGAGGKVAFYSQTVAVGGVGAPLGTSSKPGGSTLRLLSPFPVVRIAGRILRGGTLIRLLSVHAPLGAKVSIRCSGRGCPFAKQVRTTGRGPTARATKQVRVRRLERLLRPGVVVKVFVTRAGAIGKYTRFEIRRRKPPARIDRCLNPGSSRPVSCPAA